MFKATKLIALTSVFTALLFGSTFLEQQPAFAEKAQTNTSAVSKEPTKTKKAKKAKKKKINDKFQESAPVTAPPPPPPPPVEPPKPKPISITMSFAGDCTLGEFKGMGYADTVCEYYDKYGPDWFFANVKNIFAADDITYVNLEGPLTNHVQTVEKQFPIKGDVRNVNALVSGSVEVCNLANNHTWDCGQAGIEETEQVLKQQGIYYSGGTSNVTFVERKGVKIAFFGFDGWYFDDYVLGQIKDSIAAAKAQGAELIIAQFHWGTEREYTHEYTQEVLAHHTIDCGADIVIGGHPHVLQDVEIYKGKLIAYSMGNFSFGANVNPYDKDSVILQQTFTKTDAGFVYGPTKFIPCRISSRPDWNDYKPTPYTEPVDIARVFDKLKVNTPIK